MPWQRFALSQCFSLLTDKQVIEHEQCEKSVISVISKNIKPVYKSVALEDVKHVNRIVLQHHQSVSMNSNKASNRDLLKTS